MRLTFPVILGSLVSVTVVCSAAGAAASQTFPEHMEGKLGMPCIPQCTVCHLTATGGLMTMNAKFGTAFKLAGGTLVATENLDKAVAALEMTNTDSDGDGVGDVAELRAGDDPNLAGASVCGTGPQYGCGATIARTPSQRGLDPASTAAASFTVLLGLLLLRRR